jgi:hypothetical protein
VPLDARAAGLAPERLEVRVVDAAVAEVLLAEVRAARVHLAVRLDLGEEGQGEAALVRPLPRLGADEAVLAGGVDACVVRVAGLIGVVDAVGAVELALSR